MVVDNNYTIIGHPDSEMLGKNQNDLAWLRKLPTTVKMNFL